MAFHILKHQPRRAWVLMMHFTHWYAKYARIRITRAGKDAKQISQTVDLNVRCSKWIRIGFFHYRLSCMCVCVCVRVCWVCVINKHSNVIVYIFVVILHYDF